MRTVLPGQRVHARAHCGNEARGCRFRKIGYRWQFAGADITCAPTCSCLRFCGYRKGGARPRLPNAGSSIPASAIHEANMPPVLWGLLGVPDAAGGAAALGRDCLASGPRQGEWRTGCRAIRSGRQFFRCLDRPEPLGFLHIEKCGGCALLSWLARQFHPEQINADPCRDLPPHLYSRLVRAAPRNR